jgi:hypothetical protein
MVQAKVYPFVAMQWHPEKSSFEWGHANIPHGTSAVRLAQAVALAFVKARSKNGWLCQQCFLGFCLVLDALPSYPSLAALQVCVGVR